MKGKYKKTLIIIIQFFLIKLNSYSQQIEHNNLFLESKYQYGMIWKHSPSLQEIIGGNIHVFDISIGKQTFGKKGWQQLYRYPSFGFGYHFTDLGNPEELGQAHALFSYMDIPMLRNKRHRLSYRISLGLAYFEKGNLAIGSHINIFIDASVFYKLRLCKHLDLINSLGVTHFSNGAVKMPNLGVNLFTYKIGFHYRFKTPIQEFIKQDLPEIEKKNSFSVLAAAGVRQIKSDPGKNFNTTSFSVDYLRQINHRHNIGAGIDVFYDKAMYSILSNDTIKVVPLNDVMRYGTHVSFEAILNKLVFTVQVGTYIFTAYKKDGAIYERVGLKYFITKNILANITLKTSKGIAHFIEWGLVCRLYW